MKKTINSISLIFFLTGISALTKQAAVVEKKTE